MNLYSNVKNCGACNSDLLKTIFDFGTVPLAGYFPIKNKVNQDYLVPMQLIYCTECELVQINPDVSDQLLFEDYRYISSIGMTEHFKHFSNWFKNVLRVPKESKILEIGCNDGTLMKALLGLGYKSIGIDPAKNIVEIARNKSLEVIEGHFGKDLVSKFNLKSNFDVVISCNSFAHISNISEVAESVSKVLNDKGLFIVEVQSWIKLIETGAVDFIYHEHKYYYTITSINNLMKKFGLHLVDVTNIETHGGSYRLVFSKNESIRSIEANSLIAQELNFNFSLTNLTYLIQKSMDNIENVKNLILKEVTNGKQIICFGASGRGNMLIHYLKMSKDIKFIVDESMERVGRQMGLSGLSIVPFSNLLETEYDICIVLAWNYFETIHIKWPHKNKILIKPLPTFEIQET
jgi:2-polyprenyl-3-methyl-5-hydroxy-6-metoxy-1,4-benzoquinol methylase